MVCGTKLAHNAKKIQKMDTICGTDNEDFQENNMVNVDRVEILLEERAVMPQNRAKRCIF